MQPDLTFNIIGMEKDNFEMKLNEMTKPIIPHMKHEDMLAKAIINAKDKSVVSLWWLSVPLFIIIMLVMKSIYMPGTTLASNMSEMEIKNKFTSIIFFIISPVVIIIFNALSIRRIHFLSGSPKSLKFLEAVWINILAISLSVIVLIIYSL